MIKKIKNMIKKFTSNKNDVPEGYKKFNIEVTMEERWVDDFCSMLKWIEYCGAIGHSSKVGFYADGDGDFHPKFNIDAEFNKTEGRRENLPKIEVLYDAG